MRGFQDFLAEAKQVGWRLAKTDYTCSLVYDSKGPSYSIYQGKTPGVFYGHKSPSGSAIKGDPQDLAKKLNLPPIPDDLLKAFLEGVKKLKTEASVDYQEIGDRKFRRKDGSWIELIPADEHGELPPATIKISPEMAKDLGLG